MPCTIRDNYPLGTARGNTCYTCGADRGNTEKVVDWHQNIEQEGRLMQCESCVVEAAGLLGMIHPELRDEAITAMHELQRVADEMKAERDEAYQLVELIRSHDGKTPPTPPAKAQRPRQARVIK